MDIHFSYDFILEYCQIEKSFESIKSKLTRDFANGEDIKIMEQFLGEDFVERKSIKQKRFCLFLHEIILIRLKEK